MDTYPPPEKRVLIATELGEVGVGHWEPEAGWLLEFEEGEAECDPVAWMPLPDPPRVVPTDRISH